MVLWLSAPAYVAAQRWGTTPARAEKNERRPSAQADFAFRTGRPIVEDGPWLAAAPLYVLLLCYYLPPLFPDTRTHTSCFVRFCPAATPISLPLFLTSPLAGYVWATLNR